MLEITRIFYDRNEKLKFPTPQPPAHDFLISKHLNPPHLIRMAEILPLQADDIEHKDAKPTPKSTEKMDDAQKKVEGESRPPGTVLKNGIILGPDGKP